MKEDEKPRADVDSHVGNRIRMRRMFLRLSQEKLGEHLGVTFQQVQKYEKGANRIGAGQLLQIAQLLKVEPNYFYQGLIGPKGENAGFAEPQSAIPIDETLEGLALNHAFARVKNKRVRRKIVELVTAMANAEAG